jgi:hypothetical protein
MPNPPWHAPSTGHDKVRGRPKGDRPRFPQPQVSQRWHWQTVEEQVYKPFDLGYVRQRLTPQIEPEGRSPLPYDRPGSPAYAQLM